MRTRGITFGMLAALILAGTASALPELTYGEWETGTGACGELTDGRYYYGSQGYNLAGEDALGNYHYADVYTFCYTWQYGSHSTDHEGLGVYYFLYAPDGAYTDVGVYFYEADTSGFSPEHDGTFLEVYATSTHFGALPDVAGLVGPNGIAHVIVVPVNGGVPAYGSLPALP